MSHEKKPSKNNRYHLNNNLIISEKKNLAKEISAEINDLKDIIK
jgi:hypothetical protein